MNKFHNHVVSAMARDGTSGITMSNMTGSTGAAAMMNGSGLDNHLMAAVATCITA